MDTSLRFGENSGGLGIHAKQKIALGAKTFLQLQAELDIGVGTGSYMSAMIRHFYPEADATFGLGMESNKRDKFRYFIRGKKAFPVTNDGLLTFNVKGKFELDKDFKQRKSKAAAEFSRSLFNFQPDQNVRIRFGYEVLDKVAYIQIREDNWTVNADMNGKWNVRFDL